MWATKKAVSFPKRFDSAPTLLCSSMRSKRLIRMSCICCSKFWKRQNHRQPWPKDRFPKHGYHHDLGAELIKRQTAMGFGAIAGHGSYEAMRDKILDESKRVFKPEFLNRLDNLIVFHQLERNDLVKIVDLEVAKVLERVRAKDIKVHLDTTAVEFLIDKGYDPTYGARPMRRAVEKYLEDPLAEEFLRGNIKQGDTLELHAASEQLAVKMTQPEQSEPANGSPLKSRG